MPRSFRHDLSLSDFKPLYSAPSSVTQTSTLFFTHPERAERALYHPQIQQLIHSLAVAINYQRGRIYNEDDIAADVTKKLLKLIIKKKGLDVDPHFLESPNLLRGYFKQFVSWRIKDMLKKDPYWKRWTNAEWHDLSETEHICKPQSEDSQLSHGQQLELLFKIASRLLEDHTIKLSPLNRLKYIMLYCPDLVDRQSIQSAASKPNSMLALPQDIWNAWQKHRSEYNNIRKQDHKDLKNTRSFCAWILFKPHLQSLKDFEAEPDAKLLRENRFNRPVNRSFHSVTNDCIVYILMTLEIDLADKLIGNLLVSRYIKRGSDESLADFKKRKRQYLTYISTQAYAWSRQFSSNQHCPASITAITLLLKSPNFTGTLTLAELERVEHSVKHFNSTYR